MTTIMDQWITQISKFNILPQRVVLSFLGFLAIVNAYTMRLCLDIALMQMVGANRKPVKKQTITANKNDPFRNLKNRLNDGNKYLKRPQNITKSQSNKLLPTMMEATQTTATTTTFNWSPKMQAIILTSFYVGYVISQVPGAQLAERYGGKWILGIGIAMTAIFTLLTPCAIEMGGPIALIVMRFIIGLSEGPTYPALCALLSQWVPAKERGTLGVLVLSGSQIGIFMANLMSGLILQQQFEWSTIFYFFGGCALLWCLCFSLLCYNNPQANPFIKETEKQYLQEQIVQRTESNLEMPATPWKDIFTSIPMWALITSTVQYDWTQVQMISDLPKFLENIKQVTLSESFIASLDASQPYIFNWLISLTSGVISDMLINNNIFSATATRRIMSSIAVGPNLLMSLSTCFSCNQNNNDIVSIFNCAMGVMGTYYSGIKLTPLDMSPNFAGTLMGIANGLGSLTGIIAPFIRDLQKYTLFNQLRVLVWLACTILISGDVQPFDRPISSNDKNE